MRDNNSNDAKRQSSRGNRDDDYDDYSGGSGSVSRHRSGQLSQQQRSNGHMQSSMSSTGGQQQSRHPGSFFNPVISNLIDHSKPRQPRSTMHGNAYGRGNNNSSGNNNTGGGYRGAGNGDGGDHQRQAYPIFNERNKMIQHHDVHRIWQRYVTRPYSITDADMLLFREAFTHRSYVRSIVMGDKAKKKKGDIVVTDPRQLICRPGCIDLQEKPYETLELLGDSIFHYGLTKYLFLRFPQQDEGFITRLRAKIEKGDSMAKIARKMGLGQWVLISKQTEADGGREDDKILEDVFEALMGAMVMVCGPEVCTEIAFKICDRDIDIPTLLQKDDNYKDQLLRYYHRMGWSPDPQYKCTQEDDKSFTAWVVGKRDQKLAFGNGRSKPEATQLAARRMLEKCNMIGARGEALMNIRDLDALVQPSNLPAPTPESFIIGEKTSRTVPRSSARAGRKDDSDDSDSNSDNYPSRKDAVGAGVQRGRMADARRQQAPAENNTDSDSDIDSDSDSDSSAASTDSSTSDSDAAEIQEARGIRKINRRRMNDTRSSDSSSSSSSDDDSDSSDSSADDTVQARRNVRKGLPVKPAATKKPQESDSSDSDGDDSSSSGSDSSSASSSSDDGDDVPTRRCKRAPVRRITPSRSAKPQRGEGRTKKKMHASENSESSMSSGSD